MHALLIAAIFAVYFTAMAALIAYACWTGKPPTAGDEPAERDRDRDQSGVRLAA